MLLNAQLVKVTNLFSHKILQNLPFSALTFVVKYSRPLQSVQKVTQTIKQR